MILLIAAIVFQMTAMAAGQENGPQQNKKKEATEELQKRREHKKVSQAERREHHIKFVVKMLELDDATAAKFTPVYRKYLEEKAALHRTGMANKKNEKGEMTEAKAAQIVKDRLTISRKLLDTREKYYKKFGNIITAMQVKKIYDMEQDFDMKMRSMYGKRKNAPGANRHQGPHHPKHLKGNMQPRQPRQK